MIGVDVEMPTPSGVTAEELLHRLKRLRSLRTNFDAQWQEVKDLIAPDSGDFITTRSAGEKTNTQIFDMTAALALEQGAAAFETFLTPRTQRWHRLVPTDPHLRESAAVKEFFELATDVLFQFRNAPRSRFAGQMHEGHKASLAWGNCNMYVSSLPNGGTAYRYTHIGNSWMDVDYDGMPDTIFHEYKLSAKAAVARWKDKAPQCARDAIGVNPYQEHCYVHCVYPNPNYDPESSVPEAMRFVAYEVSADSKEILESGGFHELPYMWSRYTVHPGETYGRGPGMLVLPDIKTLQEMKKVFLRSGQKVADPPLLTVDDGALGRGDRRIRLAAGRITPGGLSPSGVPLVAPLMSGARLDLTHEMMQEIQQIIRRAFHVDLFELLIQDRVEMTATEVLERAREKGQLIAPVIGRQQTELLGPMIDREIKIAQRQGKLPPLPPELVEAQGEYDIEYESDATRMQKSAEVAALARTFEAAMPMIQTNPMLLELWDQEKTIRSIYETMGGASRNLRSDQEFRQIAQAAMQARAEAEMAEQMPGAAKGVRDIAAARKDMRAA